MTLLDKLLGDKMPMRPARAIALAYLGCLITVVALIYNNVTRGNLRYPKYW